MIDSGLPAGLRHGLIVPFAFITRFFRVASSSDTPPPYDGPVTPIADGLTIPASTSSPAAFWTSRAS